MKTLAYQTKGTCSRRIDVAINDDGTIALAQFTGGCPGNTTGLGEIVIGMKAEDVIRRLKGTTCGGKSTSCPDQLAHALEECLAQD